jgi:hypothetical protein
VLKLIYFNGKLVDCVKFEVLATMTMKVTVFWNVMPCSAVDVKVYQRFGGTSCLHYQVSKEHNISISGSALKLETERYSETSANVYQTSQSHDQEYSDLGVCDLFWLFRE